jgi:hypothetical protein
MHPVDGREFFSQRIRRGVVIWLRLGDAFECMRVNNPKSEAR